MNSNTFSFNENAIADAGRVLQDNCHGASAAAGWWGAYADGSPLPDDVKQAQKGTKLGKALVAQKLMLSVSELAEAMEGHRKDLMDDKLPHRKMIEVELADTLIRVFDLAGALGLDVGGAMAEKMAFNAHRPDHKPEARAAAGGKGY